MKKIFGVIGLGRFGFHVAETLAKSGAEVIAIDKNEDRVKAISDIVTRAYIADVVDEKALEESGIFTADTVIVSIGANIEASILTVVILMNNGVKEVIAKAINSLHGKVLEKLGVKRIIYPEKEMAVKLARSLVFSGILEEIPFAPGYSIFEIRLKENLCGKSLRDLDLRRKYGVNVLAIRRGEDVIINPSGDEIINKDDILLILASEENVNDIVKYS